MNSYVATIDAKLERSIAIVDQLASDSNEPQENKLRVRAVTASDLLSATFPPRDMLLSPWLESQSLTMIYAWRGVGKTQLALGLAYAAASGGKFLDWHAEQPVPVLYLDGEMPGAALRDRLARIVASNDQAPPEGYLRFVTPDLQSEGVMPDLATHDGQRAIAGVLGDARIIIVDNLSCLARTGKENEGDSWQPVAEWALRMRATGRSVVFIHHAGKGGQQRGTSKREDLLDVVIALKRPIDYTPDQGARFEVHFEKARALFGQDVAPIEASLVTKTNGCQQWDTRTAEATSDTRMIELAELGLSQADIARELGVHRSTILRALKKAQEEGRYKLKVKRKPAGHNRGALDE